MQGTSGNDVLTGTAGDDLIEGLAGDDQLSGLGGNDTLVGGLGADTMDGGLGNDVYYVDNASDVLIEAASQGDDRVLSSGSYTLTAGAHVETLGTTFGGSTAALNLTGNELSQSIYGNAGANVLSGGGSSDYLVGLEGNDLLDGGTGADNLQGGLGNDTYYVDNASDVLIESAGEGDDRVLSSVSYTLTAGAHVETLGTTFGGGTAALNLTGNELSQSIYGNAGANVLSGGGSGDYLVGLEGNDLLDGGTGADNLQGGLGNDTYLIDNASDLLIESAGQGDDRVLSSVSYTLTSGAHVETFGTTDGGSIAALNLTGNELSQSIYGNAGANVLSGGGSSDYLVGLEGNDLLDGGTGADNLQGGLGNDTYYVDNASDVLIESAGQGDDTLSASASYVLAAGISVETMAAVEGSAINLTGNELSQSIYGNSSANTLNGGGSNDYLVGGAGADTFVFSTALAGNVDSVGDFTVGVDSILLGGASGEPFAALATGQLFASAFTIGSGATTAEHRIIYNSGTGALLYDADGTGAGAAVQFATLSTGLALTAGHFTVTGLPNNAPVITSGTTASVAENSSASTIVYQTVAQDPDGDTITYLLSGADASFLSIDQSGAVRLNSPADFETRSQYSFTVTARDPSGQTSVRNVTLSVTDVAEGGGAQPYVVNETTAGNNTIGNAQPLDRALFTVTGNGNLPNSSLPSATINGSISINSDRDFFTVTLQAGELLILDVDGTASVDALLRAYDQSGAEIAMNDDAVQFDPGSTAHSGISHNLDSFLSFRAPTSGTYSFSIESFEAGSNGAYAINVSIGPVATAAQINEENIQSLISGVAWGSPNVTFGFTTSATQYGSDGSAERATFQPLLSGQQVAVRTILTYLGTLTNLTFTENVGSPGSAQMRFARSDDPDTAHAYYPGTGDGGDSWYNASGGRYDNPVVGNYAWATFVHETGHAMGLKHGHEAPALSPDRDSLEFSIMTYRSHIADPLGDGGYTNETWGFPQTYMMYDIAALQRMYGADFTTNAGNTSYSWSPTTGAFMINGATQWTPGGNRIFMTLWDGGGTDTYDFSNYGSSTSLSIDLRPGEWTVTSQVQLANLGNGNFARGNIANALLYNNDGRSLIENAIGGSGSDTIIANEAVNRLTGGAGGDNFRWTAVSDSRPGSADTVIDFASGTDRIDLSFIDAISGTGSNDAFQFIGSTAFSGAAGQLRYEMVSGQLHILGDVNGDGIADIDIIVSGRSSMSSPDFIL